MTLILPGLIDVHVHLREPGATHKEDFASGTAAALAGGYTAVLAMPNTNPAITDAESLALAQKAARAGARCDYGLYLGAGEDNAGYAAELAPRVVGLKMYLDQTYGSLCLDRLSTLDAHLERWPTSRPIAVHAEGRSLATMLLLGSLHQRPIHVCHVSTADEIRLIRRARDRGLAVTCEVSPQHLFLSQADLAWLPAGRAEVRPRLAAPEDVEELWNNLEVIDCFATDHAPHTLAEKDGRQPPPGFPGLETALGLLLGAVFSGRLSQEDLVQRMVDNPRRIWNLPPQPDTYVEVDEQATWKAQAARMYSRCGWTPFEGKIMRGRIQRVVLRGETVVEAGEVLTAPGSGRDLSPAAPTPN